MIKMKRVFCVLLSFVLVFSIGAASIVPAHAIVLDPVAWLYPVWQAYAMQAGITVTTVGGDSFTQDSFTGLFNEWQAFEVSQGVQSAAQSISGFVDDALNFVEVVAGSGSGGVLNTILKLEAGIVGPLSRFWNWIVKEKLGGTSVDSVDFDSSVGNIGLLRPAGVLLGSSEIYFGSGYNGARQYYLQLLNPEKVVYGCFVQTIGRLGNFLYGPLVVSSSPFSLCGNPSLGGDVYQTPLDNQLYQSGFNTTYNLYYLCVYAVGAPYTVASGIPFYNSIDDALSAFSDGIDSSGGAITVSPDVGVDVLGFPDTRDPDYIPADTNIGWNVPYDPTADTNAYLDQAYQQALDNELDEAGTIDDPVTGTDEVGEVGEYVVPGLSEVFPFCLPFDVYNFLSALAADPVAPSFIAELAFPEQLGGSRYIEIDLDNSTFNQLASILRTMELLLFIVGLAYVTRSKFIRG